LFDWLAQNGDRKAGHCLLGRDGRIWGIDHGLTFHYLNPLRTVIWDFAGELVPPELLGDVEGLLKRLSSPDPLLTDLQRLLDPEEIVALKRRLGLIVAQPRFPGRSEGRTPWPWI
ncbi:MAG: hypothetical protein HYY31_01655, partial [Chloroflexi bacterium]|nr:hypothetical protein [Chloroflexota bacterium]